MTNTRSTATTGGGPSAEKLIKAAHILLDDLDITMSPSKVSRLVRTYQHRVEHTGFSFWKFLANAVELSDDRTLRAVLRNPVLARTFVGYLDPTGETAVNNIGRREAA